MNNIRNFVIIAHVDHGKSTLADRFLEYTKTVDPRKMQAQYLDMMELERERGITIKMAPVRMICHPNKTTDNKQRTIDEKSQKSDVEGQMLSNSEYILNLIDTPGHSDFSYEVSRALAAVEGAILLVDATQGIQAQTIANFNIAKKLGLAIIPAINKIDLNPHVEDLKKDLAELVGCDAADIYLVSGKTGRGVDDLLQAVIKKVPPPCAELLRARRGSFTEPKDRRNSTMVASRDETIPPRALIFDSLYDTHKGIIAFVRVFDGTFYKGNHLWLCAAGVRADAFETGYFAPQLKAASPLEEGQIGYIALGIKDPSLVRIGDTVAIESGKEKAIPLSGYRDPQPVVFASFYPQGSDDFDMLKVAIEKLHLTDASFSYELESSEALGRGFRLGFLGTLHLEIIAERIKREFNIEVITTAPSVAYKIITRKKEEIWAYKPQDFPPEGDNAEIYEPTIRIDIISRSPDYGAMMQLAGDYRMVYQNVEYFGKSVMVRFLMPLAELLGDFHDRLKSATSGYASVNYELGEYQKANVLKMDVLLANQEIPEFARVLPKERLERDARKFVQHLKEVLPRENFPVAIQAKADGRIIAREDLPALKKDVTGYLYGGDRTRKMKLWKKQQRGKKKLLALARVNIPHEIYIKILKGDQML